MKLVFADEVGNRIAGFTIRDTETGEATLASSVEAVAEAGADAWGSAVELLVWLSRNPGYWAEAATSATFRVYTDDAIVETEVPRRGTESPIDRWDLVG